MSSFEEPPSNKRVRIMEDEGVEQLQPIALETAATGEAMHEDEVWCTCTCAAVP